MIELRLNRDPILPLVAPGQPPASAVLDADPSAPPQPDIPQISARLSIGLGARWVLQQPLAIGGTSTLFKLRHRLHGGCFVAKVLHPWLAEQPELRQRFRSEAAHLALLSGHPNTVPVLDLDEFDGLLYMLMPYIEGEDLDRLLGRVGALGRAESLMMAAQVASALRFAAARGVLHGDLSPGNIRLDCVGMYRLLDFGLSRRLGAVDHLDRLDRPRWTGATPSYASPEHWQTGQWQPGQSQPAQLPSGARPDIRSDLYALGAILFEALAGRPLYAAQTLAELEQQRKAPWEMPAAIEQDAPVAALLRSLLAHRREDRLASPALLLEELARLGCALPEQRERPAVLREEAAGAQRARLTAVEEAS